MEKLYSIIIPVFNSEEIIETTVKRTLSAFINFKLELEILLINDGSNDNSWKIIKKIAEINPQVKSINLLKNYGQHTAVLCGIQKASGDFLVTIDDDLQNPPEEIIKLINKINEGYDLVFAEFTSKKHSEYRKLGAKFVNYLNTKIFNKPNNIKLSNFRIFTKEVAERLGNYNTFYPYIPGLLLMFSSKIANTETEHKAREIGKSNYSLIRILKLISRLLFNYSSYPLKVLTSIGFIIALISFLLGGYFVLKSLIIESNVPGWTTIIVLISFFNGFLIVMLGILGEYVTRILKELSVNKSYQIREIVN